VITTAAGNGTPGFSGDNGPATSAQLDYPEGVAVDAAGNLYIAGHGSIRRVSNGTITTVAESQWNYSIQGIAVDSAGRLYTSNGASLVFIFSNGGFTTIAGNGTYGFSGDNGPATGAQLNLPSGLAVDSAGNVYVADTGNNRIRLLTAPPSSSLTVQTIPSGLQFSIDGGAMLTAPQTLTLAQGPHTIAVASTQAAGAGTQYAFASWSDGGTNSHTITLGSSAALYAATFNIQYQLAIAASPAFGGTVTPGGGFYNSGTSVPITATASTGATFSGWSGNVANLASASTSVTMTAPQMVTANFITSGIPQNPSGVGVYRSSAAGFWLDLNQSTYNFDVTAKFRSFGLPGDQPVAGDWTGTGVIRIGVFRQGAWYFDLNNNGQFDAGEGPFFFGLPGDTAIVGDWTGSGSTKVGVFRCPASGICTWYLNTAVQTAATLLPNTNLYNPATTLVYSYGLPGDQPVANNWSGTSNVDQIGVFRCPMPGIGVCSRIVDNVGDGNYRATDPVYSFGLTNDIAVVGNWNGNGQGKRIGIFRNGLWVLEVNGSNTFAPNDIQASFGLPGDRPVVGNWTMP